MADVLTVNDELRRYVEAYTNNKRTKTFDAMTGDGTVTIYSGSATASDPGGDGDFKFMDRVREIGNFKMAWGWCSEPYRLVYISFDLRTIITYCEGDVSVAIADTDEAFLAERIEARGCYGKPRYMDRDYVGEKSELGEEYKYRRIINRHLDPEGEMMFFLYREDM